MALRNFKVLAGSELAVETVLSACMIIPKKVADIAVFTTEVFIEPLQPILIRSSLAMEQMV
ncbi:MAG: hypothetical protein RI989_1379 [Bacteroidota bacterium]